MNIFFSRHTVSAAIIGCLLIGLAGCQTPGGGDKTPMFTRLKPSLPWSKPEDGRQGVPIRLVGNWVDTVLYKKSEKPQRGFGGRMFFYDDRGDDPILVEGQLVVYAFDETNRAPNENIPTRRYVFPAEQLHLRMSESELGPSYNIWLPWDEVGGPQTEISLICRFEPERGPTIVSEQTRQQLPGPAPEAVAETNGHPKPPEGVPFRPAVDQASFYATGAAAERAVRTAQFEGSVAPGAVSQPNTADSTQRSPISMTIPLPDDMQIRRGLSPTRRPGSATISAPTAQEHSANSTPGQPTSSGTTMPSLPQTTTGRMGMLSQLTMSQPRLQQPRMPQPFHPLVTSPQQAAPTEAAPSSPHSGATLPTSPLSPQQQAAVWAQTPVTETQSSVGGTPVDFAARAYAARRASQWSPLAYPGTGWNQPSPTIPSGRGQ